MGPLGSVDEETILSGRSDWIGTDLLETLSRHPLACVEMEFPHACRSVNAPDDAERPRKRHPVFYGCFDWHSAVHSHWSLLRQLRLFDDHPAEPEILQSLEARLTPENVEQEVKWFEANESFERPYG